jgi:hypothetical protein
MINMLKSDLKILSENIDKEKAFDFYVENNKDSIFNFY